MTNTPFTSPSTSDYDQNAVNPALTVSRPKTVVENKEFAAFAKRILRAYTRRVAQGDIEALPDMLAFARDVDQAITDAVVGLREFGYSWADVASRLGITRQAAQQRWGLNTITRPSGPGLSFQDSLPGFESFKEEHP